MNLIQNLKKIVFYLILILFPLNQQLHLRDFPTIDGVIVDYLIIKISILQILIIVFTLLNLPQIIQSLKKFKLNYFSKQGIYFFLFFALVINSILSSRHFLLSLWEILVLLLLALNCFSLETLFNKHVKKVFLISCSVWVVLLSILGIFQFVSQSSIFNNYQLFGEYPYNNENYHIKQDSYFFEDLIPAYAIFSHSNILGGYLLTLLMFLFLNLELKDLNTLNRIAFFLVFLFGLIGVFLAGSAVAVFGILAFLLFYFFKISREWLYLSFLVLFFLICLLSVFYQNFSSDSSVYRRLYQTELSLAYFQSDPAKFLTGFGYMNYFEEVSLDLYTFENIRFLQPPHSILIFLIWNFGFLFVLLLGGGVDFLFQKIHPATPLLATLLFISLFDHYLLTNHQFKILLFLIISSFLFQPNRIKI